MSHLSNTEAIVKQGLRPAGIRTAPVVGPNNSADMIRDKNPGHFKKQTGPGSESLADGVACASGNGKESWGEKGPGA